MKRAISFIIILIVLSVSIACIGDEPLVLGKISFRIGNSSIEVSPRMIKDKDNLALLLTDENNTVDQGSMRHWDTIELLLFDKVDFVAVFDYYTEYGELPILLFESLIEKSQDDKYIYNILHSSRSPNNPYGYNEVEERGYVFVITLAGNRYAYPFVILHDGSHI